MSALSLPSGLTYVDASSSAGKHVFDWTGEHAIQLRDVIQIHPGHSHGTSYNVTWTTCDADADDRDALVTVQHDSFATLAISDAEPCDSAMLVIRDPVIITIQVDEIGDTVGELSPLHVFRLASDAVDMWGVVCENEQRAPVSA